MIRGKTIFRKDKRMLTTSVAPTVMRSAISSLNGAEDKMMKQYA
jgi:hypothetical protein